MNEDVKINSIKEAIKQAIANVILENDCQLDLDFLNKIDNLTENINELENKRLILKKEE